MKVFISEPTFYVTINIGDKNSYDVFGAIEKKTDALRVMPSQIVLDTKEIIYLCRK